MNTVFDDVTSVLPIHARIELFFLLFSNSMSSWQ